MLSARSTTVPSPYIVSPTNNFEGDDGEWATFALEIGTPPQSFRVLPSCMGSEILVPAPQGCTGPLTVLSDCGNLRGVDDVHSAPSRGFQSNESSTWDVLGLELISTADNLFSNQSALYGLETVALGKLPGSLYGSSIPDQKVGTYSTEDFWLGEIGLGTSPSVFPSHPSAIPSLLVAMKAQNLTTSLSFGYTAGQAYATPRIPGSLVIGGYDKARLSSNFISVPINSSLPKQALMVNLDGIIASNTLNNDVQNLLAAPIPISIDSSISQLWLPESVCKQIQLAFGLTYDSSTDLYLVNSTIHQKLLSNNPSVTFNLGPMNGGNAINVELSYAALNLNAGIPLFNFSTPYFPIRRAANSTQYVLGRTFLQEAYLVVDWERNNFTIGQAVPQDNTTDVVGILSPTEGDTSISGSGNPSSTSSPSPSGHGKSGGISGGAIAGIVIAILAIAAIIAVGAFFFLRRRRHRREEERLQRNAFPLPTAPVEADNHYDGPVHEHYPPDKDPEKLGLGVDASAAAAATAAGASTAGQRSTEDQPIYEMQGYIPPRPTAAQQQNFRDQVMRDRELMSTPIMELPGSSAGSELDINEVRHRPHTPVGMTHHRRSETGFSSPLSSPRSETMSIDSPAALDSPPEVESPREEASPVLREDPGLARDVVQRLERASQDI